MNEIIEKGVCLRSCSCILFIVYELLYLIVPAADGTIIWRLIEADPALSPNKVTL